MANNFTVDSSYPDIRVLSPTVVQDVEAVSVRTIPSDVSFTYYFPRDEWQSGQGPFVAAALEPLASEIESLLAFTDGGRGSVVAAVFVEDVDVQDLLTHFMDFTVAIKPPSPASRGPFTAAVRVPWKLFGSGGLGGGTIDALLAKGIDALISTAGA